MFHLWALRGGRALAVIAIVALTFLWGRTTKGAEDLVDTSRFKKSPPYVVGLSNISVVNSWRVAMVEEFKAEAARHPDLIKEYYITDAGGNIAKQISDVEDLVARGIDVLLISAASPTALAPVVERVVARGIPVVTFDNVVASDQVFTLLADQEELGAFMARGIAEHLNGQGTVVALGGIAGTSSAINRWRGAQRVFMQYPGIRVLGPVWVDWAYDKAKRAMENFIATNPNIDAVWTDGGGSANGAIQAIIENGYRLIPVTGTAQNGYLKRWVELIPKGFHGWSATEPPYDSAVALRLALDILQGKPVQRVTPMPLVYITNDNAPDYVRYDLSDDFWVTTNLSEDMILNLWGPK